MSDVKECDVCGSTYEPSSRLDRTYSKVELPFRYKIWKILPWNRDKIGYVKQDLCHRCTALLPEAIELMKKHHQENNE